MNGTDTAANAPLSLAHRWLIGAAVRLGAGALGACAEAPLSSPSDRSPATAALDRFATDHPRFVPGSSFRIGDGYFIAAAHVALEFNQESAIANRAILGDPGWAMDYYGYESMEFVE